MSKVSKLLLPLILGMVLSFIFQQTKPAWPHKVHYAAADFWISDGKHKNPKTGVGCCGVGDCHKLDYGAVLKTAKGFEFASPDPVNSRAKSFFVADEDAMLSEDGNYWVCFKRYTGQTNGVWNPWEVRCFFYPVNS